MAERRTRAPDARVEAFLQGCLHLNRLKDVDTQVLSELVAASARKLR